MRLSEYGKMLDLLNSLEEAFEYIENSKDWSLLDSCEEAMTEINRCLEIHQTSVKNEDVWEKENQLITEIKGGKEGFFDFEKIMGLLNQFKVCCDVNVERKYKLLFVADIRGKWDSMSSVYEAVRNREDCEVDVVIQPIFRIVDLPGGETKKEVLYEDYLTPRGISHKLYSEYKIEEELPDITFISQPYESCTFRIFWPEYIAKYSKLVYLPYFTATALNGRYFTEMHAFFFMNVEKYAWKIACQSEKMSAYYKSFASQRGRNTVVSGLPKWDEVIKPDNKLTQCPVEWQQKLANRKVILWNSHYTFNGHAFGCLETGYKFLNMIKEMEGIALIWRPHPLTEMVIKAYNPQRYTEYQELIRLVQESDNMVLDLSTSYLTAFYCSDALITDLSSITIQYLFMNKPILMLVKGSVEMGKREFYTVDGLFDYLKLPFASTLEEQKAFIEAVRDGEKINEEERNYLRETYFPLADGNSGKRFAEQVLEDYINEFVIPEKKEYKGNGRVLLVGPVEDSIPCIKQLEKDNREFCFCKEFLVKTGDSGYREVTLQEISEESYELVVVTARNDAEQIRDFLVDYYDVKQDRALLFWHMYNAGVPMMVCDRVMQNPNNKQIDGIVIGLSHSETGIIPERLPGTCCKLSVSSQDLYYQCKTLEYCVEKYYEKIKSLKYMIIDLCDYNYFNFDTSRSTSAVNYLTYGGFALDAHNFDKNKIATVPYENIVEQMKEFKVRGISEQQWSLWQQVFPDIYECAEHESFCANFELPKRTRIVTEEDVKGYAYDRAPSVKLFKETVAENANIFQRMLQLLRLINPEMEIYTIVIPKYLEVEAMDARTLIMHESYFNSLIEELQEKYNFTHLDFKKLSDISSYRALYFDAAHLNYFGAIRFTDELKKHIFG